jgi:hypothetical protein
MQSKYVIELTGRQYSMVMTILKRSSFSDHFYVDRKTYTRNEDRFYLCTRKEMNAELIEIFGVIMYQLGQEMQKEYAR